MLLEARLASVHGPGAGAAICGLGGSGECWELRKSALPADPDRAIAAVIDRMYTLGAAGASDPAVTRATSAALDRESSATAMLQRLFDWIASHVRYMSDAESLTSARWPRPDSAELIIPPGDLLRMTSPAGDCDEFSTLALAMIQAAAVPCSCSLRTIAADPYSPGAWSHVYVVCRTDEGELVFDASHGPRLGWEAVKGAVPRRGGRVVYVARKKDWGTAPMQVTKAHVEGLKGELGSIASTLEEIIPDAAKSGMKILEYRYGNRPQGTFTQRTPDGGVIESWGSPVYPNNVVTGAGGGVLIAGLLIGGVVFAMAVGRGRR